MADYPNWPFQGDRAIVLGESCGMNLVSYGVAEIVSIVEGRPLPDCIGISEETQPASAGQDGIHGVLHNILL